MTVFETHRDCPDRTKHTTAPDGYMAWHDWAREKSKTHDQRRCPTCRFWVLWVPRPAHVFKADRDEWRDRALKSELDLRDTLAALAKVDTERVNLLAAVKQAHEVLAIGHLGDCAENRMGNGNGPCDCGRDAALTALARWVK